jgi:transcriptional regulator with XRE-family HTH domain
MPLGYSNLEEYLQERARAHGYTLSSLAEEMGWAKGYLTAAARGQFRMSVKRCEEFAKHFGDDPAIPKVLAGHAEPPPEDDLVEAIARLANSLRPHMQRTLLNMSEWLLARQSQARDQLSADQIYVERPDGEGFTVEVDGDPLELSETELRVAVRMALGIALNRGE